MESLYLLLPMSVLLVLAVIGLFAWALHAGQFDDLGREGWRILESADPVALPPIAVQGIVAPPIRDRARSEPARPRELTLTAAEPRSRHE